MSVRRRRLLTRAAALACAVGIGLAPALAAAASESSESPASSKKVTFTVGITQDVDSLNPFTGITATAYEMYQLMYDSLTGYGQKDFAAVPQLAESWEASDDGLTWTYKIRAGVKWADGQPLTADDVAYSFNRVIDGRYEQTNWGNYVANMTSVEATDPTTVVIKVKKPTPIMLHTTVPIIPEHVWKDIDEKEVKKYDNAPGSTGVVGSGPFVLVEQRKGQFYKFRANKDYWDGAPKIDELVFRLFNNEDSRAQALKRGEIDFIDSMPANVFNAIKNTEGIKTVPARYYGFNEIAMNLGAALEDGTPIGNGHPALKDLQVRLAIAHAIDSKTLTQRVLGGYGEPGSTVIPPMYDQLHYDPGTSTYEFNPEEANRILDEAGYTKGSDGIRQMPGGGEKLQFRLFGRSNSQESQQSVQFVQDWLGDIGIDVKSKIVSEDALYEIIGNGEFDLFEWGWVVEPDPDYQMSTFTCAQRSYKDGGTVYAGLSDSFFCDERYDQLYAQQAEQIDPAERAATVKEMQKILYDAVPYVITYYYDNPEAYRSDRFTGFQAQPVPDGPLLFQYGTYSYRNIRPVTQEASGGDEETSNTGLIVGLGGAAAVLIVGGALIATRARRRSHDEVE